MPTYPMTTTTTNVFTCWVGQTTTATTTTVWYAWNNIDSTATSATNYIPAYAVPQPTERELAELRAQQAETEKKLEEQRQRQKAANERAEALLLSYLDPEQLEDYRKRRAFVVRCPKSGRRYCVRGDGGISGNVHEINGKDEVIARFCAHVKDGIPMADQLLTQKFMLEHYENEFLRVANRH